MRCIRTSDSLTMLTRCVKACTLTYSRQRQKCTQVLEAQVFLMHIMVAPVCTYRFHRNSPSFAHPLERLGTVLTRSCLSSTFSAWSSGSMNARLHSEVPRIVSSNILDRQINEIWSPFDDISRTLRIRRDDGQGEPIQSYSINTFKVSSRSCLTIIYRCTHNL